MCVVGCGKPCRYHWDYLYHNIGKNKNNIKSYKRMPLMGFTLYLYCSKIAEACLCSYMTEQHVCACVCNGRTIRRKKTAVLLCDRQNIKHVLRFPQIREIPRITSLGLHTHTHTHWEQVKPSFCLEQTHHMCFRSGSSSKT